MVGQAAQAPLVATQATVSQHNPVWGGWRAGARRGRGRHLPGFFPSFSFWALRWPNNTRKTATIKSLTWNDRSSAAADFRLRLLLLQPLPQEKLFTIHAEQLLAAHSRRTYAVRTRSWRNSASLLAIVRACVCVWLSVVIKEWLIWHNSEIIVLFIQTFIKDSLPNF